MPERRRRRHASSRRHGPTPPNPIRGLLNSLRGLETASALDAEIAAGRLLSGLPQDFDVVAGFIASLESHPSTTAMAVLRGLAVIVDDDDVAAAAAAAADRLSAVGVPDPAWRSATENVRLTAAYRCTDIFGDGENLVVVFKRQNGDRHALVTFVDHNLGGIAKDVWPTDDPDELLTRLRKEAKKSDLTLVKIPPSEAAGRLLDAVTITDRTIGAPTSEEYAETAPVLRARILRSMPRPMSRSRLLHADGRLVALSDRQVASTVKDFLTTFTAADHAAKTVAFVTRLLVRFDHNHKAGTPGLWSTVQVEIFLADWLPRHVTMTPAERAAVVPVMSAYVEWAAERAGHDTSLVAATIGAVGYYGAQLDEVYADPTRWGAGRLIIEEMIADGVDLDDERAVARWIQKYNRSLSTP